MGRLSTHVLDTTNGRPASGIPITLLRFDGKGWSPVASAVTNADGRTDKPLLEGSALTAGEYRLEFAVGEYFRKSGAKITTPPFLDLIPIQIGIADPALHYHVPLLCTPWSYSTYRGS